MDSAIRAAYDKMEEAMQQDEYRTYWAERKYEHDMISQYNGVRNEGIAQGREQGIIEGIEQGIEQGSLEIARNLKKMGLSITQIIEGTGLSPEVIEKL